MSAAQFKIDLRREWAEKQDEIRGVVADIALTALSGVVIKSPVGNPSMWKTPYPQKGYVGGRFRGNWIVSIGSPVSGSTQNTDKSGQATITKGQSVIDGYSELDTLPDIWIQNNLPYAKPLENGHSNQAPNGMVALTVVEINAIYGEVTL